MRPHGWSPRDRIRLLLEEGETRVPLPPSEGAGSRGPLHAEPSPGTGTPIWDVQPPEPGEINICCLIPRCAVFAMGA